MPKSSTLPVNSYDKLGISSLSLELRQGGSRCILLDQKKQATPPTEGKMREMRNRYWEPGQERNDDARRDREKLEEGGKER